MTDPVVQVVDQEALEILYTLRIKGDLFRPKVFRPGRTYTVIVGEPGTDRMVTLFSLKPVSDPQATVAVEVPPG